MNNKRETNNKQNWNYNSEHAGSASQSRTRPDLARMALALDCIRMKLSLPKRSPRTLDFGVLVMMPSRLAKKEKALHASTPQTPYVSTARGTQVQCI